MPFDGSFTQEIYAQKMIDEYVEAGKLEFASNQKFLIIKEDQTFDPHLCFMYINTPAYIVRYRSKRSLASIVLR